MANQTWYSQTDRQWTLKIPGTGRVWKIVLGLTGVLVFLMVLFAGDKSLLSLLSLYKERDQQALEMADMQKTNQKLKQQIAELRAHPQAVEPIAREELGLVRAGELVYRFIPERAPGSVVNRSEHGIADPENKKP